VSCPSFDLLASYHADRSKDSEIGTHLEACAPCRGVLSTLAASPELAAASRREHAPGTEIGRFVVEGVLGRGAMGVVYTAHDPRLGRRRA
jgi:eukaryotic-like serine/threonine-protein kinase